MSSKIGVPSTNTMNFNITIFSDIQSNRIDTFEKPEFPLAFGIVGKNKKVGNCNAKPIFENKINIVFI